MTQKDTAATSAPSSATSAQAASPHKLPPHKTENWDGYTLDQLRYQRAYTLARIEINGQRLKMRSTQLVDGGPKTSRNLIGKMLSAFSYVDLALLAWRIGSKIWQTSRIIKR